MKFPPQDNDWIYAPNIGVKRPTDEKPAGHGTCVASKAVGARYGVARNARLAPVKIKTDTIGLLTAFSQTIDDIQMKQRVGSSVVVMPLSSNYEFKTEDLDNLNEPWSSLSSYLMRLKELKTVVVAAAGNNAFGGGNTEVNSLPALFAGDERYRWPVIAVGAVDNFGVKVPSSQKFPDPPPGSGREYLFAWASGQQITCPGTARSAGGYITRDGTSFAAGMVGPYPFSGTKWTVY